MSSDTVVKARRDIVLSPIRHDSSTKGPSHQLKATIESVLRSQGEAVMMMNWKTPAVLAAAFVGLFAGTSRAQEVIDAKVPFAFVVSGETFPAGEYEFSTSQPLLAIRGRDNGAGVFAMTTPAGGRDPHGEDPVLVFTKYDNTYRLSEIWESEREGQTLGPQRDREAGEPEASNAPTVVISADCH
jgi:hypothetical protein